MERKKVTPQDLLAKKQQGRKIVRVVCYDYPMALLADRAEVDSILVGIPNLSWGQAGRYRSTFPWRKL